MHCISCPPPLRRSLLNQPLSCAEFLQFHWSLSFCGFICPPHRTRSPGFLPCAGLRARGPFIFPLLPPHMYVSSLCLCYSPLIMVAAAPRPPSTPERNWSAQREQDRMAHLQMTSPSLRRGQRSEADREQLRAPSPHHSHEEGKPHSQSHEAV